MQNLATNRGPNSSRLIWLSSWTIFIWICAATCTVQCLFLVWRFRLLGSDFAPSYCTNQFRGPGFRLSEKRWSFLSRGRFRGHRKFGRVGRTAEPLFTKNVLDMFVGSQSQEDGLAKLVVESGVRGLMGKTPPNRVWRAKL